MIAAAGASGVAFTVAFPAILAALTVSLIIFPFAVTEEEPLTTHL